MDSGMTRSGRVFSPFDVIRRDFDAALLLRDALGDDRGGLDDWELEPLTPLSSPAMSPAPSSKHPTPPPSPTASPSHGASAPQQRLVAPLPPLSSKLYSPDSYHSAQRPARPTAAGTPLHPPPSAVLSAAEGLGPGQRLRGDAQDTHLPSLSDSPAHVNPHSPARNTPSTGNHAKRGKNARRTAKRASNKKSSHHRAAQASLAKHIARAVAVSAPVTVRHLPIARGGFVGVRQDAGAEPPSVEELQEQGFTYLEWDGRTPQLLVDRESRVVGVLAGRPLDDSWDATIKEANRAMRAAYRACRFRKNQEDHRRGKFATLARGVSFGGGQMSPGNIQNTARNERALAVLCRNEAIVRIAGFGSSVHATYGPLMYRHMSEALDALYERHASLRRNFPNSAYPAASFNFGPSTICVDHTDSMNDPCNWCQITALGDYDPSCGGCIVLYNLKLIIRYPPGSSILIPSAIVRHSNIGIRPHETRMSLTQYCAGGLIRWVECGFRTVGDFEAEDPEGSAAFRADLHERATRCVKLFSTLDSLPGNLAAARERGLG